MNQESFEKIDQELFEKLQEVREKKVPASLRSDFSLEIERRIEGMGRPFVFHPGYAILPICAVLGAALCWFYLKPEPRVPEPHPAVLISAAAQAPTEKKTFTSKPLIVSSAPSQSVPVVKESILPQITESNLVSELEVLKELGVWTEEDEQEIGISRDLIFEELETFAGDLFSSTNSSAAAQSSRT